MTNTKTGTTWAPDIRPEKIETFEETYTPEGGEEQTLTYRAVDHHPILGSVLDKLAFFRTHVGAVWYNLAERKTLLTKLNELDAELREVNAKIDYEQFVATVTSPCTAKAYKKMGVVVISIRLPGGVKNVSFSVPSEYACAETVTGSFTAQGSASDAEKCAGVYMTGRNGQVWLKEALTSTCVASIMYPV